MFDISTEEGLARSVEWLRQWVSRINDGGVWMIPRSGTCYSIRHATKTAIKTVALLPDPSLDKVFKAAGWTVKEV